MVTRAWSTKSLVTINGITKNYTGPIQPINGILMTDKKYLLYVIAALLNIMEKGGRRAEGNINDG
jgi:hypothetical protein